MIFNVRQLQSLLITMTRLPTLTTLAFASLTILAAAQNPGEPTDLTKLRESWQRAIQQANAPLDKKYEEALTAMKTRYTKDGKLQEALAVDNELKMLASGASSPQADKATAGANPIDLTKRQIEKVLLGSNWAYYESGASNTERGAGPGKIVEFHKDGSAVIEGGIQTVWKLNNNGELIYRPEAPKYVSTLTLTAEGVFSGKCTGTSADTMKFIHLVAQPKP